MTQLPDRYRVTEANPDPPLVHFAIPVHVFDLYQYAEKHNLIEFIPHLPHVPISPASALSATDRLSQEVKHELEFGWLFAPTADCGIILSLYDNYTMKKKLIDEDQEHVIRMVQEELGLDKSVRPKWYFDVHDSGDSDDSDESD
jgi:hypothetical protein